MDHADSSKRQEALACVRGTHSGLVENSKKKLDHKDVMDPTTNNLLGYAGVRCRVLGTFYADLVDNVWWFQYELMFGSELEQLLPESWP